MSADDLITGSLREEEAIPTILAAIGLTSSGTAVEVGAGDGNEASNARPLLTAGWRCHMIEADPKRYRRLLETTQGRNVVCLNEAISLEAGHRIDDLVPGFDLLSLDIDGIDYWIWRSLKKRPAVVVIEYNSNWATEVTVPADPNHQWDGSQFFGASASALRRLGRQKGYDLVGFTSYRNLYFVRSDLNRLPVMRDLSGCIQENHHRALSGEQEARLFHDPHATRLHLGCGDVIIPGYQNIDTTFRPGVDDMADARYLHRRLHPPESARTIYASNLLEHFGRWEYESVLRRWHDVLELDGVLRLAVPDFDVLVRIYQETGDLDRILGSLYGGQDFPDNFHRLAWNEVTLTRALREAGFRSVRKWDWRRTEHWFLDDNSQAYHPHMDKETGVFISLNLEAVK